MTTLEKLVGSIKARNGELYIYTLNDERVKEYLPRIAKIWDDGESFNIFTAGQRVDDGPDEWEYLVADALYVMEREARRIFFDSLTVEQATAICQALIGDMGAVMIGGMRIGALDLYDSWRSYHPDEPLQMDSPYPEN